MSRNAEYQFVPTDTSTIEALLVALCEKLTGATIQPGSPDRLLIQWVSNIIVQERVMNNYTGNQNIPSRAEGRTWTPWANCSWSISARRQRRQPVKCGSPSPRRRSPPS